MFNAYLAIMLMGVAEPVVAKDNRGPYETLAACEARVEEGKSRMKQSMPRLIAVTGACVEEDESI